MKNVIRSLIYIVVFIIGMLVFNGQVYAKENCAGAEYACAVCIYYDDNTQLLITYTAKSDGTNLKVTFDIEYEDGIAYTAITNNVPDKTFSTTYNRVMCPNIYYVNNTAVYSDVGEGRTELKPILDKSIINNKDITKPESKVHSCSFIDKNTNVKCVVTQRDGKVDPNEVECDNGHPFVPSKSDIKFLNGKDFSNCSGINVDIFCDNGYYDGGCYINEPGKGNGFIGTIPDGGSTSEGAGANGDQVEELNKAAEYRCHYVSQFVDGSSRKFMDFEKKRNNGMFLSIDGHESKPIPSFFFPSNECDDLFLIKNNDDYSWVFLDSDDSKLDIKMSTICNGYNNKVIQFCHNNSCKISNPLCGSYVVGGEQADNGEGCPWQLRAIIIFLKKVVFDTVRLVVPIVLIIMGTIDFVKAVASPDDKGNKEAISKFIRRCLAAIMVFFVGTIVTIVMNMFSETDMGKKNDWQTCWETVD